MARAAWLAAQKVAIVFFMGAFKLIYSMPHFLCKIGTADGRIITRQYESSDRQRLTNALKEQGFHVFQIRRQIFRTWSTARIRVSGQRFLSFNQELLVLLRSGLPVLQIFDTQIEQMEAGPFRDIVSQIREDVRGGSALSEAFAQHPDTFPSVYVAALRAGERTGDLAETFSRYLDYQKRVEAIRAKVRNASFYPLLLTLAAVAVVIFLMLFVVPRFTEIYADAEVQLPLITRILITVSHLFASYWYVLVAAVAAGVALFRVMRLGPQGRFWLARQKLKVPFFGALLVDYSISSFTRTLSTSLVSGTPLVKTLQMSVGTLNNLFLEQKMIGGIKAVEEGASLSEAFRWIGFFPPLALRMVRVGETSGSLTDMLNNIADYYESEVERRLQRLTTMIEPVLMMSMGLLIAFIIVAMYVPIFQLAATVG